MKINKLKTIKCIRSKALVFAIASWFVTLLILIIGNGNIIELILIPIGATILTFVYCKMHALIKKLEDIS